MTTTRTTWRQKLAAVLEWSSVDKGQIPLLMLVPIMGQYSLWGYLALQRPDRELLVNVPALEHLMTLGFLFIGGGVLLMLLGLLLRRRNPDSLLFQHLAIQYYASVLVFMGYQVGLTEISTGLVLLGAPVFGFIVMARPAVWSGTLTALALFFALGLATVYGHLPYAPIMAPVTDAATAQFQFYSTLSFAAPHFIIILLLADRSLHFWRQRENTIREISRTDMLTGIPNRRSIMEALDKEVARTRRHGPPMCVVILDLDHFKKVNDTWGHPTGDKVLQEAARVLRESIRSCDCIGRYGGEEFMLVLPDTTPEGAAVLLERCRAALAATIIRAETGKTFHISASFGVVCNVKDMATDAAALIKLADEALYRAKEKGRNRVEIAA
jgi:diguanylate cyclase (GGDEF)-like protein